jgi:penicillin G amidase
MAPIASSPDQRTVQAAGLDKPAEILIDAWGIPHIYAATVHDAFFTQGWNAARDRLWQLDLWRKKGLGVLAESLGPDYVAHDRAARLFLYRGDMQAEWAAYGPDAKTWSAAFVEGVNAYVRRVLAGEAPLPVEFELTGSKPALWALDDMVRIRSHGLNRNAEYEALRARVVAAGGVKADRLRRKLDPDHALKVPDGLDPSVIPADLLTDYMLATKDLTFGGPAAQAELLKPTIEAAAGSNNWVIAPTRTATGRAMLASDPHRVLVAPSIRYIVHMDAPGFAVMGAGELHLPGVTIGHNEAIAFGITVFMSDQEDLYVYELNPENPRQYRYDGGWEEMRIVTETIAVRGEPARKVQLAFTRHGPVLKLDEQANRAFALRTVWSEPGTSSYFGAARYQTAKDWESFKAALTHWRAATMNFVYADVAGNIGWKPSGAFPRRHWDGLLPVPGDGRYEWNGFLAPEETPTLHNPPSGWIATANEMNLPDGYPMEEKNIGFEWADPSRANRIAEVLSTNASVSVADSQALQMDVKNLTALRATAFLAGLVSPDPEITKAIALLSAWDGRETVDSTAAAIAQVWMNKHLAPKTIARTTNPPVAELAAYGSPYAVVSYLEAPDQALGEDPLAARHELVLASLRTALDELAERLGPDMDAWRWGQLHHIHLQPAASALAEPGLRTRMRHGPTPVPGSALTPAASTYDMETFAVTNGASFRMVVDVGAWDESRVINTPGQSGDPQSPHYNDLFPLWAKGEYVPMLWSRAAVEQATRQVIRLEPG